MSRLLLILLTCITAFGCDAAITKLGARHTCPRWRVDSVRPFRGPDGEAWIIVAMVIEETGPAILGIHGEYVYRQIECDTTFVINASR